MHTNWKTFFDDQKNQLYYLGLTQAIENEYANHICYPPKDQIFHAFRLTPLEEIRVVILGQDPYHGPKQAHGLAFSVQNGVQIPPSLRNMFVELHSDLGIQNPKQGSLEPWAKQGVFLLNQVLTVRQSEPNSHKNLGWEQFSDNVIQTLNQQDRSIVFVLWGSHAQKKLPLIDQQKHFVIQSPHPSPLSAHRGFLGSKPYSKINDYLNQLGHKTIDWRIK